MGFISSSFTDMIGLIGVILYIGSYASMQFGFIRGQTYTYAALNALAAGCVLLSLSNQFNLSSAVIQVFWIAISIVGIARLCWLSYRTRFNDEEKQLLQAKLPGLTPRLARRFLDSGFWVYAQPGTILTEEGKPVAELIYLAQGHAEVSLGGHTVGFCQENSFIGEITCLKGDPASATVTISEPSRYFCIGAVRLRQLCARNPDLRRALEESFATDTSRKLLIANEKQRNLAAQAQF